MINNRVLQAFSSGCLVADLFENKFHVPVTAWSLVLMSFQIDSTIDGAILKQIYIYTEKKEMKKKYYTVRVAVFFECLLSSAWWVINHF